MAKRKTERPPKKRTITRKVFFYRVNAGVHSDTGTPREVDFGPTVRRVRELPFTTDGRYLDTAEGKQICCWPDTSQPPYRIRLANIRRGQYPPVENAGEFSPLVLGAGRGLAEITHLVLFPGGYCGAEFNFYGPRAFQLPIYFALKVQGSLPPFRLNPVVRPDLEKRLKELSDIKLLDLKVRASYESILTQADADLGAALNANVRAVNARPEDEFQLIFKRRKNKKLPSFSVPEQLLNGIRKLAKRPDLRDNVSIFKVSESSGAGPRFVDILHEQFTVETEVEPALDQSGGVESSSMFEVIERAYAEMQEQLSKASEIE